MTEGIEALQKKVKKGKGVTKLLVEERLNRVSVRRAADGPGDVATGGSQTNVFRVPPVVNGFCLSSTLHLRSRR